MLTIVVINVVCGLMLLCVFVCVYLCVFRNSRVTCLCVAYVGVCLPLQFQLSE